MSPTTKANRRSTTLWTKDKIAQVITLYRKHDCLWNHYKESYKSKESRKTAIDEICKTLRISQFEYGKKIHNLRNQFNSEMKKLERRIEESGCESAELSASRGCRWEHFESLMFLRDVIAPRPAGFQSGVSPVQVKKLRVTCDYNSEDDLIEQKNIIKELSADKELAACQFVEAGAVDDDDTDFRDFDDAMIKIPTNDRIEDKHSEATSTDSAANNATSTSSPKVKITATKLKPQKQPDFEEHHENSAIQKPCRDQWDVFGELLASEFRNLNSDVSRKHLKRKIMQAMLEVGEEDDDLLSCGAKS